MTHGGNGIDRDKHYDAIVIGSGIGGLAAAAVLARVEKKRVLVLERHFEMGGMTHLFSRGRFKWEVGVHYVGRMVPGLLQRAIFDFITEKRLRWISMPDPFERFIYPAASFDVPTDWGTYKTQLREKFPNSAKEIDRYFRHVEGAAGWFVRRFLASFLPRPLAALLRVMNRFTKRIPLMTTKEYMDRHITDPRLANILCSQWGDYGVHPEKSAFALHSTVTKHYGHGGFFPEGNTARIASSIERVIEKAGGSVLTNRTATEVLIEDGRAVGVRVEDTRDPLRHRHEEFFAPRVISNIGVEKTVEDLLGGVSGEKHWKNLEGGNSSVTVYLGLKESPEKIGVAGENFWINEVDGALHVKEQTERLLAGAAASCYVSFPSLRMGETKKHTGQIIAFVDYDAFSRFGDRPWRDRSEEYYELKRKIASSLIELAQRHIPGLADLVEYVEVSTPISIEHFSSRRGGYTYGFKDTPAKYEAPVLGPKTEVPGLYLSGTDVCSLGVVGAMLGGVAAASVSQGPFSFFKTVGRARRYAGRPAPEPQPEPQKGQARKISPDKVQAELVRKERISERVLELVYRFPCPVAFRPGQYARILYSELDYGSYSIAGAEGELGSFLIDTSFGGTYASYFEGIQVGELSTMRLPIGDFVLQEEGDRPKVFIATGTGIAPQRAMIQRLAREGFSGPVRVLFGAKNRSDLFAEKVLEPIAGDLNLKIFNCTDEEEVSGFLFGRVTDLLENLELDHSEADFYVSGNPYMVTDVVDLLKKKGAARVISENY